MATEQENTATVAETTEATTPGQEAQAQPTELSKAEKIAARHQAQATRKPRAPRKPPVKKPGQPGLPLEQVAADAPREGFHAKPELTQVGEAGPEPVGPHFLETEAGRAAAGATIDTWLKGIGYAPTPAAERLLRFENPQDMQQLVAECRTFIADNKLYVQLSRGRFVNVEGWTFAASRLGWVPEVAKIVRDPAEFFSYRVKVEVKEYSTGKVVGNGWGLCTETEPGKQDYTEFAIMSMAQTRATGKACRNLLAWVIRAAGFEPTPAEEMEFLNTTTTAGPATPPTIQINQASLEAPRTMADMPLMTAENGGTEAAPTEPAADVVQAEIEGTEQEVSDNPADYITKKEGKPIASNLGITDPANQWATTSQKEEIIRLLNHPKISRQEKTKMLLNINRLTVERATAAIAKLRKAIEDREAGREAIPVDPKRAAA